MGILIKENNQSLVTGSVGVSNNSSSVEVKDCIKYNVVSLITDSTPIADTFVHGDVTVVSDTITLTAHGMTTGLKCALTTDGVLPTGLSATDYFIIVIDVDTVSLATSANNATAGTAVTITAAAGGGTHTLTPYAIDGTVKLQASLDDTNFIDIDGSTQTINSSETFMWDVIDFSYKFFRVVHTVTSGQFTVACTYTTKWDVH